MSNTLRRIERVGIVVAPHRPSAIEIAQQLAAELQSRGCACVFEQAMQGNRLLPGPFVSLSECAQTDLVIVLGGDGTLLVAAHEAAPLGTPLLGVDMGSFGFLAAEDPQELFRRVDQLLAGDFVLERRVMLKTQSPHSTAWALNDIVVAKSTYGRIVRLRTYLDGDYVATFPADGLIIATATGSTAYNLSAGGPIVDARMEAIVLTPICPHTLYSRPLLVPSDVAINIQLIGDGKADPQAAIFVDGAQLELLHEDEQVHIMRAPQDALLVQLTPGHFYHRLREKLKWGMER